MDKGERPGRGSNASTSEKMVLPSTPKMPRRAPQKKMGRPRNHSSDITRQRILDAAEALFAEGGYDATSIRDVAAASNCQIQAVSYHFGQKENLFETVIQRRAMVMTELRENSLAALQAEAGDGEIELAKLIRAYVEPFVRSAGEGDVGWRNYAALMGRLANSQRGTEVIARHYDETAKRYLAAFKRRLPAAPERGVAEMFTYMVASMLSICAATGRVDRLSKRSRGMATEEVLDRLVAVVAAGFLALTGTDGSAPAGAKDKSS